MADKPIPIVKPDTDHESLITRDTLQNLITGMGGINDPAGATRNVFRIGITPLEADAMYVNDWLGAAVINAIPDDMTREWREISGLDDDPTDEYLAVEKDFLVQVKFNKALKWGRLYGGAGIVMGIDGAGEMDEPLEMDRVKKGSLKWLTVLDRYHLVPTRVNTFNPLRAGWDEPEYYRAFGGPDEIHRSRILFFYGVVLPYRMAIRNWFWGGSILDRVIDAIQDAGTVVHGVAQLVTEAKVDVFKFPGLFHKLQTTQGTNEILERVRLMNLGKSINNAVIMDDQEDWEQKTGALTQGLAGLVTQFLEVVAGASGIPVTRLLGTNAPGLMNGGEENTRNYYDHVKHLQRMGLDPPLAKMDDVLQRHVFGSANDDFETEFNNLWQQSETERSVTEKQDVERDLLLLQEGVIAEHHIAHRLMLLKTYPTLDDKDVKELEGMAELGPPDPLELPLPGAPTPGAPGPPEPGAPTPPTDPKKPAKAADDGHR